MKVSIRKANLADVPAIVKVHTDTWRNSYRGYISDEIIDSPRFMVSAERIEKMKEPVKNGLVYVACVDGKVVGFLGLADKIAPQTEIKVFYVDKEFQRCGIGSQLFRFVLSELKEKGCEKVILWTMINYPVSNNFYKKMGGFLTGATDRIKIGADVHEYHFYFKAKQCNTR